MSDMIANNDNSRRLAAVLFDMDGTLLDSEKLWTVALNDLAHWLGGELSAPARAAMVGSSLNRSLQIIHDDLGVVADPQHGSDYFIGRTAELFRADLTWRPGALELLSAVNDAGIPAVLVTSTQRLLTEIALDFMGREHFVATLCGDEVTRLKPAPDPYLMAAGLVPADPRLCVAVEDSMLGVESAEAAGCALLAVVCEMPIPKAPTRTVVDSLADVTVADLVALVS